jgi:hypothetical protein
MEDIKKRIKIRKRTMVKAKLRHEKDFHCRNKNDPKSGRKTQRSEEIATNTAETEKIGKREDK